MEGRESSRWVIVVTLALSVLAHAPMIAAHLPAEAPRQILASSLVRAAVPRAEGPWKLVEPAPPEQIAAAREALVAEARAARRRGELELGGFLLRASEIDAAELGVALDIEQAEKRYARGLATFRRQAERGSIFVALREAYGDMHYHSIGGNMADALLENGGSCEQLTHLIAATLHDGAHAEDAFVRYYGGGTPHLAPIYRYWRRDFDVVAGREAFPGGVQFPAADLIEVYARKHGLGEGPTDTGEPARWSDGRSSFAGGYPPNDDAFGGVVPLFAESAFGSGTVVASRAGGGGDQEESGNDPFGDGCPMRWWDRLGHATVGVLSPVEGQYSIELVETDRWAARRLAEGIARWEARENGADRIERLVHHACLTVAYEKLAVDLALLDMPVLAHTAQDRSLVSRERVADLAKPGFTSEERKRLVQRFDAWVLSVLPDPLVLSDELFEPGYGSMLLWSLLESEATRDAMLEEIERRPLVDRMTAILSAQVYTAPRWEEPLPPESDVFRARRAFMALLQRMQTEPSKDLSADAFVKALVEEGFPPAWAEELRRLQRKAEELERTRPDLPPEELNRLLRQ